MTKTNQQGFGLVGIMLIVLVVGLIGFAGFRIYDNNADSKATTEISQGNRVAPTGSSEAIDSADKALDDPTLDSGVDDKQLDDDMNSLL